MTLMVFPAAASAAFGDRPLRMGMKGDDVRVLQTLLTKAGFRATADGHYGRRTRRAVGRWEGSRGRAVDGRMSRRDQLALHGEFEAPISADPPPLDGVMLFGGRVRPGVVARVDGPREVRAEVADAVSGAVVRVLRRHAAGAGEVRLRWNGRGDRGRPAPEGAYLVRLGDPTAGISAVEQTEEFDLRHHVFPIGGKHDLGRGAANGFGGGRGHQGQDMFADCGTPVRAAQGGKVVFVGYHSAAGHYVVIRGAGSGEDYVYMHLRDAVKLDKGDRVKTAERIGAVGRTGRAEGCHLHFELWSKPGWYNGGSAYDPLGKLRDWDRWS
jgi:murein DD-endopeptidase MepM/ murein hydrolase activator NlpD